MPIIEPAIRPPAEAESFLLQVTLGCSSNCCTFCGAYLGKPFQVKTEAEIAADISVGIRTMPDARRIFLMDGDALAINNDRLLPVLDKLQAGFPKLSRIASYANAYNITSRTEDELAELYQHQLKLIYLGLESGSQEVLDRCRKRSGVDEMIHAVRKADKVGIKASVMVLLGLGGRRFSRRHVEGTIKALNRMQPRYLSFLSVMLIPETPLFREAERGEFEELSSRELLEEAHAIIDGLELEKTIFRSDHASNHLPLQGRFPVDKERILGTLEQAINGHIRLRPDYLRDL